MLTLFAPDHDDFPSVPYSLIDFTSPKKTSAHTYGLKFDSAKLKAGFSSNGLVLDSEQIEAIQTLANTTFKTLTPKVEQFQPRAEKFLNVKRAHYPNLPKMHIFASNDKGVQIYFKLPVSEPKTGRLKSFGEAICLTLSTEQDPQVKRVGRLKNKNELNGSNLSNMFNDIHFLKELKEVPHVCQLLDSQLYNGKEKKRKIVMYVELFQTNLKTYLDGIEDLQERLKVINKIGCQLFAGLKAMHARGIIHKDIKPQNLLVNGTSSIEKLYIAFVDFDLASTASLINRKMSGTPNYIAPEFLTETSPIGPAIDLWALGCILHELYYGMLPLWKASICYLSLLREKLVMLSKATESSTPLSSADESTLMGLLEKTKVVQNDFANLKPVFTPTKYGKDSKEIIRLVNRFLHIVSEFKKCLTEMRRLKVKNRAAYDEFISRLTSLIHLMEESLNQTWEGLKKGTPSNNVWEKIIWGLLNPDPNKRLDLARVQTLLASSSELLISSPSSPRKTLDEFKEFKESSMDKDSSMEKENDPRNHKLALAKESRLFALTVAT